MMQFSDSIHIADTVMVIEINEPISFFQYISQPNTIIAIAAIFVSITAVIFSIIYNRKTFNLTKKHNILSTKPILTSEIVKDYSSGEIIIALANNGLGPAQIKRISFRYLNYHNLNLKSLINDLLINGVFPCTFTFGKISLLTPSSDYCLAEKSKINLFEAIITKTESENIENILKTLGSFKINVTYYDIYDTEFVLNERLDGKDDKQTV